MSQNVSNYLNICRIACQDAEPILRPKNRQMQAELTGDASADAIMTAVLADENRRHISFQFLQVGSSLQLGDLISQPGITPQKDCEIANMDRPGRDISGVQISHPALPVCEVRVLEP